MATHLNIRRLGLRDYRCFESLDIDFHPRLTALVAANGAGKTSILDAVAVALGPYIGAFSESVGKHFEASDIRLSRVRDSETNEMEYAPQGVNLDAVGDIPDALPNRLSPSPPPSIWRRALSGPTKAKTTIKDAKALIDYGKRLQEAVRTPGTDVVLPLIAYYGTGRLWQQKKLTENRLPRTSRTLGYADCLDPASSYKSFLAWFRYWSMNARTAQLAAQERGEPVTTTEFDTYIASITRPINLCLASSGWKDISYSFARDDLVAHHEVHGELPVALLSDGVRNTLAMVADIAFRATKLNPQLGSRAAIDTPGIVLIDEVDMHLHPSWQQTIIGSLLEAFPLVQFIVSTHSPQVLSTIKRDCIRMLGGEAVERPLHEVKGIESAMALTEVMGVNPVPPVEEARLQADYIAKIESGTHGDDDGLALRRRLVAVYGEDHPVIRDADRLIRFQAFKLRDRSSRQD